MTRREAKLKQPHPCGARKHKPREREHSRSQLPSRPQDYQPGEQARGGASEKHWYSPDRIGDGRVGHERVRPREGDP